MKHSAALLTLYEKEERKITGTPKNNLLARAGAKGLLLKGVAGTKADIKV
ncbi:MAG: hypothetical protein ACU0A8_12825 [Limimaricola soesokkakensis]